MPLRAAFFDVGDTLVEHWAGPEVTIAKTRARISEDIGEQPWLDDWLAADIEPVWDVSLAQALIARGSDSGRFEPEHTKQETARWYREWFAERGIDVRGVDLERLRTLMCLPLDEITSLVPGAIQAVRWCVERGLRVVLVTNTLSRGDEEALLDWERFGVADAIHAVVSSHSAGWRKPHPAIFERALELAGAGPAQAFHVGDNLIADVWGAQQVGIRAVWRRPSTPRGLAAEQRRAGATPCKHPSSGLFIRDDQALCGECGSPAGVRIVPDAIVEDLTELPPIVETWLQA